MLQKLLIFLQNLTIECGASVLFYKEFIMRIRVCWLDAQIHKQRVHDSNFPYCELSNTN